MLTKLIKYEFYKRWKALKYILLGYILIQSLLLIISRVFFWDTSKFKVLLDNSDGSFKMGFSSALTIIVYFLLALIMCFFAFIESIYRFDKDLSGKQAVLEIMLPAASWKKITAKMAVTLVSTIVCGILGVLSIDAFTAVNGRLEKSIIGFDKLVSPILENPVKSLFSLIYLTFILLSVYIIFFLCIAFSRSLSNKNKVSGPIGVIAFALCIAIIVCLGLLAEKFPVYKFDILGIENSVSSMILDILVFFSAFFGTSWLTENKIEH